MSDQIFSGGPGLPWPSTWRLRHDPKAPRQDGTVPSDPPTFDEIPPLFPENPPTITGTGSAGCQIWIQLVLQDSPGVTFQAIVDAEGKWSFTFPEEFPVGHHCINVWQRCPSAGDWSDPAVTQCFDVPDVNQTVDFEANQLRYDSANLEGKGDWGVRGMLAYRINGRWVYGVLRHVRDGGDGLARS